MRTLLLGTYALTWVQSFIGVGVGGLLVWILIHWNIFSVPSGGWTRLFAMLFNDCRVLGQIIADWIFRLLWTRWIIDWSAIVTFWAKVCLLCFLWAANDHSMYWPQLRQWKIGLMNQTSHYSWEDVVITAAKTWCGCETQTWSGARWWTLRSNKRLLGLDLSDAVTNQRLAAPPKLSELNHQIVLSTAFTRANPQQQRAWSV